MSRQLLFTLVLVFAAVLVSGCCSARRGEPITGPIRSTNSQTTKGQLVFQQYCHQCHPGGEGGLGPSLNDKPLPGFLIKLQVRSGLGVMPGFDKQQISNEELDALAAYLAALRESR